MSDTFVELGDDVRDRRLSAGEVQSLWFQRNRVGQDAYRAALTTMRSSIQQGLDREAALVKTREQKLQEHVEQLERNRRAAMGR